MNKIITKAIVKTLVFIIGLCLVAIIVFNFAFPSKMGYFTAQIGNYSLAINYAKTQYDRSKDVADLDVCFDYAVQGDLTKDVITYGKELEGHKDFNAYCQTKDEQTTQMTGKATSYMQYVYGTVAIAYAQRGEFDKAIDHVVPVTSSFYATCAMARLAVWALSQDATADVASFRAYIAQAMDNTGVEKTELYNQVYQLLIANS